MKVVGTSSRGTITLIHSHLWVLVKPTKKLTKLVIKTKTT